MVFFCFNLSGKLRIILLGFVTLLLFPVVAAVISYVVAGDLKAFVNAFRSKEGLALEVAVGLLVGLVTGIAAWKIITTKIMLPVLYKYGNVVKSLNLNLITIIFLSICAGVGEEIFFRGVLQDYFGVIITAILFVAIHGYLSFSDWRITIYGTYMSVVIVLVGFLDVYFGLSSAIIAHTVIDIVLFYQLTHYEGKDEVNLI